MRRFVAVAVILALGGCASTERDPEGDRGPASAAPTPPAATQPSTPEPGTVPPDWLFTRALPVTDTGFGEVRPTPRELRVRRFNLPDSVPPLPGEGFASRVDQAPAEVIARSTWKPGCPVRRDQLDWVRVTYRGFDGQRHTGELLTHEDVSADLVRVFRDLWKARFPIEEMRITEKRELDLKPTGDGNNIGSFVCRPRRGGTEFSEHARGLAIDINPFQNPYRRGEVVIPELASAYLDRENVRPGMIFEGGPVVTAFDAIGWQWGGRWRNLTDLHHFSRNGR
ncbi:M15 family metallopeptidase [Aeromicrobium sp.]|uniref:M15 family metallopeptidase n=1 Tax=Aeromicrobium sp. TaxID=1871063 RepID=UPI003D6A0A5D